MQGRNLTHVLIVQFNKDDVRKEIKLFEDEQYHHQSTRRVKKPVAKAYSKSHGNVVNSWRGLPLPPPPPPPPPSSSSKPWFDDSDYSAPQRHPPIHN
ncbi:hypothetical protein LIER_40242 [Lithospermum erythrorhizon]|uniref:Uncharacterized protein n=1 Tax=Lithospermum erythrorhizon TaxID=34254 RepID=A0AAV3QRP8_LITER